MHALVELSEALQVVLVVLELLHDFDEKLDCVVLGLYICVRYGLVGDSSEVVDIHEELLEEVDHVIYADASESLLYLALLIWKDTFLQEVDAVVQMDLTNQALVLDREHFSED